MFGKRMLLIGATIGALFAIPAIASAAGGFDQFGYNDTARIFNGTGSSWCEAGGQTPACLGIYSSDKLVMKWNAAWDACNDLGTPEACAGAWINNEWNGNVPGGSGEVWHYKIVWFGTCTDGLGLPDGGYCVWGAYEVIMDQGTADGVHSVLAHATPNGYGGR